MPLNWKETELILSELDLSGALIQKVVQNNFHAVTWMLYSPKKGSFALYTEVGTPQSRICLTTPDSAKNKTAKLQRFVQFARANIEGARICSAVQTPGEREVDFALQRGGQTMHIIVRLFSGPGANIIVTDADYRILDLLLRRPGRGEVSGSTFRLSEPRVNPPDLPIRDRIVGLSFNEQIDSQSREESQDSLLESLRKTVESQRDRQLARAMASVRTHEKTMEANAGYEELQHIGDLLSASVHLIGPRQTSIELEDYQTGQTRLIALDPSLKGSQHVSAYYEKAKKARGTYENAENELATAKKTIEKLNAYYAQLLTPSGSEENDIRRLKAAVSAAENSSGQQNRQSVGVTCRSGMFEIVIGRTAKENDQLLRHGFKGSDYWFHTRDCPGAYVFVRCPKTKTIPLEVMLDAGNLAALYSKERNNSSVNLYYTRVKYLRRAKDGPLGLVIPSQEKNLTIKPDRARAQELLGHGDFTYGKD